MKRAVWFVCAVLSWGTPMGAGAATTLAIGALSVTAFAPRAEAQRRRTRRPRVVRTARGAPELHVVATVQTSVQPKSVEVSPDGRRVWVCNFGRAGEDNVFVYDSETLDHVGTVEFEGNAVETTFSPDGATAYISNFRRGVVEVVDTTTFQVKHEIEVGANPKFMVVSPDGTRLYVALYSQQRVAGVDLSLLPISEPPDPS